MTNTITLSGNLTADPELRFTSNGIAVVNFTIAHNNRVYNSTTKEWVDGETLFMRCSAWRDQAENIASSLTKGTQVIVIGALKSSKYKDRDGAERTAIELEVENVGPSLRFATARVTRATRSNDGGNQRQENSSSNQRQAPASAPSAPQGGFSDEPPF